MAIQGADQKNGPLPGVYRIDPEASRIRFRMRALFGLFPIKGTLSVAHGRIAVEEPESASTVEAVIPVDSFSSGHAQRDRHVRSADYLDSALHPEIRFHGGDVRRRADGEVTVHGELTVRGVARPLVLTLDQVVADGSRLTLQATAVVDRYAFGVTHAKGMTGRRLRIALDVVAVR
ncbi:YceI family protein [Streptomyces rectiverticillatus]|uniref:YceI family protein n=1 Tax=Streptomyces rectiverticillatus TaxID=173860 RepID=UPI0015C36E43|nr:YceI family protein [Streptomyces rectiverticillatus]QLE73493.1 YceI family protein [Streptomyces rectiverticillatus]